MIKKLFGTLFFIATCGGILYGVQRSQDIIDWWQLRDYTPSQAIEALARNAGFNERGDKLFYVHDPQLLNKQTFTQKCTVGEATIVLGCYIPRQGIYVLDVQDDRLDGVEEVTAAHEMLHAAFFRLSPDEKEDLEVILRATFDDLEDVGVRKIIQSYEERDPSVVSNELHSILATEVRELPSELERHYAQFFDNRMQVVTLAEKYDDEFDRREKQIESYDAQLAELEVGLQVSYTSITAQSNDLESLRALLQTLEDDPEGYNRVVDQHNALVTVLNDDVARAVQLEDEYNEIVVARNAIAHEETELVEAIDTRVETL